ncbi:carbonic anhydrase 13 [Drosophila ficusphila]|uniref:carbonic anhydrase 13 n=1 Tax=Drosophila ficusphila TaxID=30025 RepID=UPI0007E6D8F4|nr:carbonic anhydrase 13 [Drosophila ficusphila]
MHYPMMENIWLKFMDWFSVMMNLAEDSRIMMMLISCTMALALILNVQSGSTIFRNLINAGVERKLKSMLDNQPSPINIDQNKVIKRELDFPLKWKHYKDIPMAVLLENNGTTVILRIFGSPNFLPVLSGGDLLGKYQFVEAIFKWGVLESEHSIGGGLASLEMQALHRCPKQKGPWEYLTISYLFKLSEVKNERIKLVTDHLKCIQQTGSSIELPPYRLSSLLRPFSGSYYTYPGTYDNGDVILPTTWIIDPQVSHIKADQLAPFKFLCGKDGSRIFTNSRNKQPQGNRVVQFCY